MKVLRCWIPLTGLALAGLGLIPLAPMSTTAAAEPRARKWTVTWSDEFNQPDGKSPDPWKWKFDTGGDGWGNKELEYYTSRPENAVIRDGMLVITARRENYTGPDGVTRPYTSARLKTQGLFSQAYGRFEARIRIPHGQGIWPAFWMMGDDVKTARWPACGEIDIFENIGKEPDIIHGTVHGTGCQGHWYVSGSYQLAGGHFADDFHVYAVEWEPNVVRFYVDQSLYKTVTRADLPPGAEWPFNHPFFLLLNVAVGGTWPGNPDSTTVFPQSMLVDYVRVYRRTKRSSAH